MDNAKVKGLLNDTKKNMSLIDGLMSNVHINDDYEGHLLEEALSTTTSAIDELQEVIDTMETTDIDVDDEMTLKQHLIVDCSDFAAQDAEFWLGPTVMDVTPLHNAHGDISGYEIVCCTGGPHIFLDTYAEKIIGRWGKQTAELSASPDVCQEVFECLKGAEV